MFTTHFKLNVFLFSFSFLLAKDQKFEFINVDKTGEKKNVGFIQLNRPKALNALCNGLMMEVSDALDIFEADKEIGAIVLTGNEKAFAGKANFLMTYHISPQRFPQP